MGTLLSIGPYSETMHKNFRKIKYGYPFVYKTLIVKFGTKISTKYIQICAPFSL